MSDAPGYRHWERHGDMWRLIDKYGYVRAMMSTEDDRYICVGLIGCGMPVQEYTLHNRRTLERAIEKQLREAGY